MNCNLHAKIMLGKLHLLLFTHGYSVRLGEISIRWATGFDKSAFAARIISH